MLIIQALLDDVRCYDTVRSLRWPSGVRCPDCDSDQVIRKGRDETQQQRQRYECSGCHRRFDDLTGTIFAGQRQPLRVWGAVPVLLIRPAAACRPALDVSSPATA
jgi:transposase-like protein